MAKPTMATIDYTEGGDYIGVDDTDTGAIAKLEANCDALNDYAEEALHLDGTAGRVLRKISLTIEDATTATEIKCTVADIWNGTTMAVTDDIGKGETVGNFTFGAAGGNIRLEAAGLGKNVVVVISCDIVQNASGVVLNVIGNATANDIIMYFRNASTAAAYDLGTLVDTGSIILYITYVTSS